MSDKRQLFGIAIFCKALGTQYRVNYEADNQY